MLIRNCWLVFFCLVFFLQYGPVVQIDLKIPPRPPGYAFVEVSALCNLHVGLLLILHLGGYQPLNLFCDICMCFSLRMLGMLMMQFMAVMVMTLMGIVYGFVNHQIPEFLHKLCIVVVVAKHKLMRVGHCRWN